MLLIFIHLLFLEMKIEAAISFIIISLHLCDIDMHINSLFVSINHLQEWVKK